jgi:hypothetical protein
MKITKSENPMPTKFREIREGDVFLYDGDAYIKLEGDTDDKENAVCTRDWSLYGFTDNEEIEGVYEAAELVLGPVR